VILFFLHQKDSVIDWLDFFDDAVNIGKMKKAKVIKLIERLCQDVFDSETTAKIISQLEKFAGTSTGR
jgi:hypothetical protein